MAVIIAPARFLVLFFILALILLLMVTLPRDASFLRVPRAGALRRFVSLCTTIGGAVISPFAAASSKPGVSSSSL